MPEAERGALNEGATFFGGCGAPAIRTGHHTSIDLLLTRRRPELSHCGFFDTDAINEWKIPTVLLA
jgi:hypothetical protein